MKSLALFLIAALVLPQEKAPAPKDAELKEAEKLVRDLFKEEFSKKAPADRRLLARKLLGQGREPGNPAATQYTLLSLAIEQAVQAVDLETAKLIDDGSICVVNKADLLREPEPTHAGPTSAGADDHAV